MKIAGITWWRNNYGSILQAYALQRYLIDVEKIDYTIINQYSKKMASFDNLIDKLKTIGLKGTIKRFVFRFGLKKLRQRVYALQEFVDNKLVVTEEVYNENNIKMTNELFDGFICGSDQIWNPSNTTLDSIYWLGFVGADKLKISYAPSIGIATASKNQATKIKENLESFDAISSREESGTKLINEILGRKLCKTVIDPTMLVDREVWDDLSEPLQIKNGKYIFVYLLKGTVTNRKKIQSFAKYTKLPIITMPFLDGESVVPYDLFFGDIKLWNATPNQFISAIRGASYVFTDSFHCMVFSCLYHKSFYLFKKKGALQMSRLSGLQKLLNTGNRLIQDSMENDDILKMSNIDWNQVDGAIIRNKNFSRAYISEALKRRK